MTCPACEQAPVLEADQCCLRCCVWAADVARATGIQDAPQAILDQFIGWAKAVRLAGGSLPLAVMAECRQAPRADTDTTFFRGYARTGGAQFDNSPEIVQEAYMQPAREAGVSVAGKHYFSELAAFPGDPRAWVDSKGDARRLLEERGWSCPELGVKPRCDFQIDKRPGTPPPFREFARADLKGAA